MNSATPDNHTPSPTAPKTSPRRAALFLFKLALSVTLLVLIFRHLGSDTVIDVFTRANIGLLLLGAIAIVGQTAISSLKWKLLLRRQGSSVAYLALLRAYLVSNFINLFMPSVLGGDAYRAAWLRRHIGTISTALPSIILDRLTGLVALIGLATVGLSLLFAPTQVLPIVGAVLATGVIVYLVLVGPVARWLQSRPSGFLFGAGGVVVNILQGVRPSPTFFWVMGLSLTFQLNTVLLNWLYSIATGITVDLTHLLIIVPAVYMAEMLPVTINGLGLREGAFAVLFAQAGLLAEHGMILGLTVSVMRYVAGLVGGALLAIDTFRQRRAPASDLTAVGNRLR